MNSNSYDYYLYEKRKSGHRLTQRNDHAKTEGHLQAKERPRIDPCVTVPRRNQPCADTWILDFKAPEL